MAERLDPTVRRARILEAAMAIIDAEGHQSLSMRAVAEACGMTPPGLMHYFKDLPSLVVAVVAHRDERDGRELPAPRQGLGETRRHLDAIVDNIIARPHAAELFAIVEAEALDSRHPGHAYFRERAAWLVEYLEPMFSYEFAQPRSLARLLFAAMDGLQLHFLRDQEGFDLRAEWATVADAVLAAAPPASDRDAVSA